jgi:hypothetical protein
MVTKSKEEGASGFVPRGQFQAFSMTGVKAVANEACCFFSQSRIRFMRFYIKKGSFKYKGVPAPFSIHSWSPQKKGSKQH